MTGDIYMLHVFEKQCSESLLRVFLEPLQNDLTHFAYYLQKVDMHEGR